MTPVTAAKVKYGVWGLIGGAIIAMIIGFGWGGWTTTRTTKRLGNEAVLAAQAAGSAGANAVSEALLDTSQYPL